MGFDWVRLHAALNDLPAALLLVAVLFDLLGAINRRESLRAAGFWCLLGGMAGGGLAALAGELAEGSAIHSDRAHALMETHETMAFVMLGIFGILTVWRLVRRIIGTREQTVFTTVGVVAIGLLVFTGKLGGNLVFDHGTGISNQALQAIIAERQGGHVHEEGEEQEHGAADAPADSAAVRAADSTGHSH